MIERCLVPGRLGGWGLNGLEQLSRQVMPTHPTKFQNRRPSHSGELECSKDHRIIVHAYSRYRFIHAPLESHSAVKYNRNCRLDVQHRFGHKADGNKNWWVERDGQRKQKTRIDCATCKLAF